MRILDKIRDRRDLAGLSSEELSCLCAEIREFLVSHVAKTGGHLASNLGVVELTVAIETVFDTNTDRLVFDVGHQSYIHKLLTGRQADFDCLRQFGGMAGFPKPSESQTDAFVAGHASSSVSVALGMARARTLKKEDYHVIALMGDGAATGGMAYEGLNDAAVSKEPMVIILNDNEMSIDRNVGGMAKHLSRLRTKERYLGMKEHYRNALDKLPGGRSVYRVTRAVKQWLKRMVLPTTIFDNMGLAYLGPVDGHDLPELIRVLRVAKELSAPVVVHVLTHKGHGYRFAEENPSRFHGIGKFDPETGASIGGGGKSFSDAFGETMVKLAQENEKLCAITAAMPGGTGLLKFKESFPDRLFDVGIAEEHAVSMAGGLAKQGMVPVVALYSTFLQRAYDQILQDISMLGLHVVLAVDRAGLVGEDGETHHGVFDVGFLRQAPGMLVLCPASCCELSHMLTWAVQEHNGPVAVRYPRGKDLSYTDSAWQALTDVTEKGTLTCHREGKDLTIITYGTLIENAMDAAKRLSEQGIEATVLRLLTISPLPVEAVLEHMAENKQVIVVEETNTGCGIHAQLSVSLRQKNCTVEAIDLGKGFVTHGSLSALHRAYGMDGQGIANFVMEVLHRED